MRPEEEAAATLRAERMVAHYPEFSVLELADRHDLAPQFQALAEGISELTFAGIYCFAGPYAYQASRMSDGLVIFSGRDKAQRSFFLCPFGLPAQSQLNELFTRFSYWKLASLSQVEVLSQNGCAVTEDRDNFDYLYRRVDLAQLPGRALQKKRNLVHRFLREHRYSAVPLTAETVPAALAVLDIWRDHYQDQADYQPARIALENMDALGLQGRLVYADDRPAGYSLGEPFAQGRMFVVHYEKALPDLKGLSQFVNMEFAQSLPESIEWINREQDVGELGLRQSKLTYRPSGFVKKFRVEPPSSG